jgi:hypothetical protein
LLDIAETLSCVQYLSEARTPIGEASHDSEHIIAETVKIGTAIRLIMDFAVPIFTVSGLNVKLFLAPKLVRC